jgi:diaminopimelate epimerase
MTVFNSNGTFALMCGNGLRCVAAYLYSNKKVGERFVVATDSGDKEVEVK